MAAGRIERRIVAAPSLSLKFRIRRRSRHLTSRHQPTLRARPRGPPVPRGYSCGWQVRDLEDVIATQGHAESQLLSEIVAALVLTPTIASSATRRFGIRYG